MKIPYALWSENFRGIFINEEFLCVLLKFKLYLNRVCLIYELNAEYV